jgi:hypothetical protein
MSARRNNRAPDLLLGDPIVLELRRIAKILAMSAIKGSRREEQIGFLNSVTYTPAEIGEMLGIAANAVSVTLYQSKNKGRGRSKRAKK